MLITVCMILGCACGSSSSNSNDQSSEATEPQKEEAQAAEKNGDVYILFTSDVHCAVDQGFGYAGLKRIRDSLEAEGYETILVDNGDFSQGEQIGAISKGETIIELMNEMHYDAAIPGNHEFDYGMEQFLKMTEMAQFPIISCNFNKQGELVFAPYIIKEAAGMKIAFVGVTTPTTLTSAEPRFFQNEEGEYIYGFMQDESGEAVYQAVQDAVDAARAEGADYVYVLSHCGNQMIFSPWTYADIISHTNGIDVYLDGHSHDTDQVVMLNKDGEPVPRSACGTQLHGIGYSHISAEKGIVDTNIWSWPNTTSAADLFHIENDVQVKIKELLQELDEQLGQVIARTDVTLTLNDPVEKDEIGNPIRMIRRAETNMGDFCTDAIRSVKNTDIAIISGGCIRANLEKGDVTYRDIISIFPWGNQIVVVEATGQQILDALEWGSRSVPEESGAFLQVSGLTYEIDVRIPTSCVADENGLFDHVAGARRVKNVTVGGEPIDPAKTYTVASIDYILLNQGDGFTSFDEAKLVADQIKKDDATLIDYITETLGGSVGEEYADQYGQGRITILQ